MGRSRFLAEVSQAARLQGYEVIKLRGDPALRPLAYGALIQGYDGCAELPPSTGSGEATRQALDEAVRARRRCARLSALHARLRIASSTSAAWTARAELGQQAFAAARAAGREMRIEQAVAFALGASQSDAPTLNQGSR